MQSTTLQVNSKTSLGSNSRSVSKNNKSTSVSTKASANSQSKSGKKKYTKIPKISKICSIEDQSLPNLDDPSSYDNMMDLLQALKNEMTLKINEASKMVIKIGDSYSVYFKPSEDNLIIFRGFTALISKHIFTENTLEELPWTEYQLNFDDPKPSVANYLSAPYKITENLLNIVNNPQKAIKLSTFEKVVKYYNNHYEQYKNFLDQENKDGQYSSVVHIWIQVFTKIMGVQTYINSQGMYDESFLQHYKQKKLYFHKQQEENKKQEIINYMNNMKPIVTVNGSSNNNQVNVTNDDVNKSRRKSFSGLPLPSTYDEINEKIGGKKSKHINAVHFLEVLAKNSENIIKHFDDVKKNG